MPLLHLVEQRSEAWDRLRLGIPTASNFNKIVTPGGKASQQWKRYAHHLIAERLLQRDVGTYTSPEMERGMIVEEDAVDWYEMTRNLDTQKIGFITTDDGRVGCSPDRLIGNDGLLEIKCPKPAAQVEYLITGTLDNEHKPQLQGQLYVSEREWVDVLAWHEELPKTVIRVERDEAYIALLAREIAQVNAEIDRVMGMIGVVSHKSVSQTVREMLEASLAAER